MPSRRMSPAAYHWLEWGPLEGGGSQVSDVNGQPIRTGSRVVSLANPDRSGEIAELVSIFQVLVRWDGSEVLRPAQPSSLRLLVLGTT